MSTTFIHWIRMKIMVIIILSCHFTTNSRESLHIIGTFDYSYFTAYFHITHINGHTQLWLFVNDRFEFLILQILYIGIFESLRIEQLEIRIYEKRPQTRSNVAMATNIFSQSPLVYFQKIWKSQNCQFWRYALLILSRRYVCSTFMCDTGPSILDVRAVNADTPDR